MSSRLMSDAVVIKLFIVLREQLCNADKPHPLTKTMTVEQAEKLSKYADKYLIK